MNNGLNYFLPDNWNENNLECLIASGTKITYGVVQPGEPDPNGVPFIRGGDIHNGKIAISKLRTISQNVSKSYQRTLLKGGELLMSLVGYPGEVAIVPESLSGANIARQAAYIKLGKEIDSKFVMYYLQSDLGKYYLFQKSTGSAQQVINLIDLKDVRIIFPPLPEQQKIAAILTSVDEVIEKKQAQCDKLKDLKTAMMQTLFTKGIGIDGKPHTEFKDSPVGRIPKGWGCCLLDKVARRGSGHTPDKQKPEYWNGGINWVSLTDSSKLDRLYLHNTLKKISELGIDNSSATLHPKGTVVMTRDAGIGKSAIITSSMAVSQHFMAWICGDKLNNYFLYYLLQLWKPKFETIAMGSTIKTIGLPYFKKLQIPVPSITEQQLIANALNSVDEKIFILQRKHSSLVNTKKALMQDLLTGKVRVTVPTPSSAKAS